VLRKARRLAAETFVRAPFRVFRDRLRNGLRVCTIETPHLHSSVVALYVRAGARYERASTNGLSHFVEHMLFRGSDRFPSSLALNRAIEERGGTLYAETGRDYSLYQVALHPREVGGALDVLGDLFTAPRFSDIERERSIIVEELLDDLDDRGRNLNLHDLSRQLAWAGHPLGLPVIGPMANVRRFGVGDVRRHFRRFYGARNMVLCVAGPIDRARVVTLAAQAFSRVPPGRRATPRPARVPLGGPRLRFVYDDSSQVQMHLLFHGLPEWDPDFFALGMVLRLIDDGMSTPLHYRVCDQKGLAYHVGAGLESLHDASVVEIEATCSPKKAPALAEEVLAILAELKDRPAPEDALAKAKRRALAELETSFDDIDGLAGWFGGTELFFRPWSHAQRAARIAAVSASDVVRAARRVLQPRRMCLVTVGATSAPVTAQLRRLVRGFDPRAP
jgi:predicted Zn-dependent peptidase